MDSIVGLVSAPVPGLTQRKDDDTIDRLSSRYTVIIILVFAAVITLQLYLGEPLVCWAPVHFTYSHMVYANSYCWIKNTYYLPWNQQIPKEGTPEFDNRQVIPYYQWIPFILLLQALFFYIPSIVWHGLNQQGGIDADNILQAANLFTRADQEESREGLKALVTNQIDRFLATRLTIVVPSDNVFRKAFNMCCGVCGRRFGAYLVVLYMIVKVLYIANVVAQFFVLNSVLGTNFNGYGFELMQHMVRDDDWTGLPNVVFPRVTMCDFKVRRLGNLHRYSVQCALRINLYNEKIYVFLWFWFFFIALVSVLSFVVWLFRFVFKSDRRTFLRNHLDIRRKLDSEKDEVILEEFMFDYLKQDGVFILRLISHNTNNITTTEIICALWEAFKVRRERRIKSLTNGSGRTKSSSPSNNNNSAANDTPAAKVVDPSSDAPEKKPLIDSNIISEK